jgi:hypothetical protein
MNEIKKRFIKMTCKSCNKVSVIEYEQTTDTNYDVTMGVQMGCNDALKDVSQEKGSTPHHAIKTALNRLKRTMGYGIPDKET